MDDLVRVRLDKWLWAARFYKTRSLAAEAIDGGKVHVNGERVKRAKQVQVGDDVEIRQGPYEYRVIVRGLSERRGPAPEAAKLYEERPESKAAREAAAERLRLASPLFESDKRRPTKRDRRAIDRFKRGGY
ncbi:MAG TPA: S4 domain-containing protein [Gemmatimonadales bacterium]|nr:S4 domain-containing protein [Gemmatimonadales bacterium]